MIATPLTSTMTLSGLLEINFPLNEPIRVIILTDNVLFYPALTELQALTAKIKPSP